MLCSSKRPAHEKAAGEALHTGRNALPPCPREGPMASRGRPAQPFALIGPLPSNRPCSTRLQKLVLALGLGLERQLELLALRFDQRVERVLLPDGLALRQPGAERDAPFTQHHPLFHRLVESATNSKSRNVRS